MNRMPRSILSRLAVVFFMAAFAMPALAESTVDGSKSQRIEVAFVLDVNGSMSDLIDGAKRKIWSIVNTIIDINPEADIRIALITYRDWGAGSYEINSVDMTEDVQGLYSKLVKFGDRERPKSFNQALDRSVQELEWTKGKNAKRIAFLVGDAPFQTDDPNDPPYPQVLKRAQDEKITFNTVQVGENPDTAKLWQKIAQMGQGHYFTIPQDGGRVTVIETPLDHDILVLQQMIDKTIIPYGSSLKQAELRTKLETKAKAPASVQVDNSRYYSKKGGSKEAITGGGDLVADVKNGVRKLDLIKDFDLPENLRGKSIDEKQVFLDQQSQKRGKLEIAMTELIKERDIYLADQATTQPRKENDTQSLDKVVTETLRDQLK